jgi:hypothetical protein
MLLCLSRACRRTRGTCDRAGGRRESSGFPDVYYWSSVRRPGPPSTRLAPFFRLQRRQRTWTLLAVLAPPQDRGITWSKCKSWRAPQLRQLPPSRCHTNRRVATLIGSVSLGDGCTVARAGRPEDARRRRTDRLRRANGALTTQLPRGWRGPQVPASGRAA